MITVNGERVYYLEFLYSSKRNVSSIHDVCQAFWRVEKGEKITLLYGVQENV